MPKSIIIKKNGGPEVLELQDVNVGSPGPDEIKVTNHAWLVTLISSGPGEPTFTSCSSKTSGPPFFLIIIDFGI